MNKLKIELFEQGKKVKEVESNNYVAPIINHQLAYAARQKILPTGNLSNNTYNPYDFIGGLFNQIVFTASEEAIDTSKEYFENQTVVGYADRASAYVGSDILKGTVNANESYGDDYKQVFVFDFATDKANGTFRSIFLTPNYQYIQYPISGGLYAKRLGYCTVRSSVVSSLYGYTLGFCEDSNYYYRTQRDATSNSNLNRIIKYNKSTFQSAGQINLTETPYPLTSSSYGRLCTDGTNFYVLGIMNGVYCLIKFGSTGAYISHVALSSSYTDVVYKSGLLYLSSSGTLYEYNPSTLSQIQYKNISPGTYLATDGTLIYGISGSSTTSISSCNFEAGTTSSYGYLSTGADDLVWGGTNKLLFVYGNRICDVDFTKPNNIGARILLPASVTKNNTQVMKVTYTFNFA